MYIQPGGRALYGTTESCTSQLSYPRQGLNGPSSLALWPARFHIKDLLRRRSSRDSCLYTAHSRALSPIHGEPCPAVAGLWTSRGAHRLWLSLRDVPAPPSPSSRLQLPGEAGQFPLVVDDLQLLDISPGAGWTPGAQGLLRAWRKGEPSGGYHGHFSKPTLALSREQPRLCIA